ncbi:MAG TPA: adenylyltransferase/cytidyltransferase family protein [Myxococcota bacterium]
MSTRRALIISSCRAPGPALTARVTALTADHDDVIVAVDDHEIAAAATPAVGVQPAPLPARWAAARRCVAGVAHAFATALPTTSTLLSAHDRLLALRARLGACSTLVVDSPALAAAAKALGIVVDLQPRLADNGAVPPPVPAARRALVVVRAQPFHRGHLALVEHAARLADEVVVVVAAAERSHSARDPFTAGERLSMVRAALAVLPVPMWIVAVPSPTWPALALTQLAAVAPTFDVVVAHNPVLRAMASELGIAVEALPTPLRLEGAEVSATAIRARLVRDGAGPWLGTLVPDAVAAQLATTALLQRVTSSSAVEQR